MDEAKQLELKETLRQVLQCYPSGVSMNDLPTVYKVRINRSVGNSGLSLGHIRGGYWGPIHNLKSYDFSQTPN